MQAIALPCKDMFLADDRLKNLSTPCEIVLVNCLFKEHLRTFVLKTFCFKVSCLFVLRTCKFSIRSCSHFFISFVPLLSVKFAPNSFCFSIFFLGESPQILPQVLSSYCTSLLQKKHNILKIPGSAF